MANNKRFVEPLGVKGEDIHLTIESDETMHITNEGKHYPPWAKRGPMSELGQH